MKAFAMIAAGIMTLAIGALVYVADRPVGIFSRLGDGLDFIHFGRLGYWLPDGLHPLGMALISAGVAGGRPASLRFWAIFWGIIGLCMETGQYFGKKTTAFLPAGWQDLPFVRETAAYFIHGTFDPMDMVAVLLGSLTAWLLSFSPCLNPQQQN